MKNKRHRSPTCFITEKQARQLKPTVFYRQLRKNGQVYITMAILIFAKGTKNTLPDIRIGYARRLDSDPNNGHIAKNLAYNRALKPNYDNTPNGISDYRDFHVNADYKFRINNIILEFLDKYDNYNDIKKCQNYYKILKSTQKSTHVYEFSPISMLSLVRECMPVLIKNKDVFSK